MEHQTNESTSENLENNTFVETSQEDNHFRKIPDNLRPVKKIFNRDFSGLYYDDITGLFYSTNTKKRTRTFCPMT
jgi:hypothetical protein